MVCVISILGMSGKHQGKKTIAYYECTALDKVSGDYHNATDFLLQNYEDRFYFLGTQKAIDFQKELLDYDKRKVEFISIEDNSLDNIFERVYTLIEQAEGEKVLLDITHGFRHQFISAIFSATLHKFLKNSQLDIIFAKQIVEHEKYEYIYLNEYIDTTQLSLLLTGFIQTLNFVDSLEVEGLNTLAFKNFSQALLANDFKKLQSSYKNLKETLKQAKTKEKFTHLKDLFIQIEETLKVFEGFETKELYEKYMILAQLMFDKNYYLIATIYLFEALRLYCAFSFKRADVLIEKETAYLTNQRLISFISNYKKGDYEKRYPTLYEKNKESFEKISLNYDELRQLRNDLTHINHEESQSNIKSNLSGLLQDIKTLSDDDILQNIKV